MVEYTCKCCNFTTTLKPNYHRHLKTSKHMKLSKSCPKVIQKTPKSDTHVIQKGITETCSLFSVNIVVKNINIDLD